MQKIGSKNVSRYGEQSRLLSSLDMKIPLHDLTASTFALKKDHWRRINMHNNIHYFINKVTETIINYLTDFYNGSPFYH